MQQAGISTQAGLRVGIPTEHIAGIPTGLRVKMWNRDTQCEMLTWNQTSRSRIDFQHLVSREWTFDFWSHSEEVIKFHPLWNWSDFCKPFFQPFRPHCPQQDIPSKIFLVFTCQSCISSISIQKILCSKLWAVFVVCNYLATVTTFVSPLMLEWVDQLMANFCTRISVSLQQ